MKIPQEVLNLIKAARELVRARRELLRAKRDEASASALKRHAENVRRKLDALDRAVVAFDVRLNEAKKAAKKAPFDWHGFFGVAGKLLDLAGKIKKSASRDEVVRDVQDIIDAEIIG